jgi:hypothetical protein
VKESRASVAFNLNTMQGVRDASVRVGVGRDDGDGGLRGGVSGQV